MRQWRIGSISMGILFILLGVLLLIKTFIGLEIKDILFYGWPIILILLGLEVLVFSLVNKQESLKFSFLSIVIIFFAFIFTFFLYAVDETGIFSSVEKIIASNSYPVEVNTTLDIPDNVTEVAIDLTNGDLKVTGAETDSLDVTGIVSLYSKTREEALKELDDIYNVNIVGNRAIISIKDSHNNILFGGRTPKADLNIIIPMDLYLKIDNVNGSIDVNNAINSGKIKNVNGDIYISRGVGDFSAGTVNGKIYIQELEGKVAAETTNGRITIENVDGELNLKTTNGDIQVSTSVVSNDWKASTVNGKISLELPENTNARISAESNVSDVSGNLQWTNLKAGSSVGSEKESILGDGLHKIYLKTLSGKIEVNIR